MWTGESSFPGIWKRGKEPGLQQVNVKFLVSVQELETGGKEKYIIGGLQRIKNRETRNICAQRPLRGLQTLLRTYSRGLACRLNKGADKRKLKRNVHILPNDMAKTNFNWTLFQNCKRLDIFFLRLVLFLQNGNNDFEK